MCAYIKWKLKFVYVGEIIKLIYVDAISEINLCEILSGNWNLFMLEKL